MSLYLEWASGYGALPQRAQLLRRVVSVTGHSNPDDHSQTTGGHELFSLRKEENRFINRTLLELCFQECHELSAALAATAGDACESTLETAVRAVTGEQHSHGPKSACSFGRGLVSPRGHLHSGVPRRTL